MKFDHNCFHCNYRNTVRYDQLNYVPMFSFCFIVSLYCIEHCFMNKSSKFPFSLVYCNHIHIISIQMICFYVIQPSGMTFGSILTLKTPPFPETLTPWLRYATRLISVTIFPLSFPNAPTFC